MTSTMLPYWILAFICMINIVFASPPRIKTTVHIKENAGRGAIVAEISQLVRKERDLDVKATYKLISQKIITKPNSFSAALSSDNGKWLDVAKSTGTVRLTRAFDRDLICPNAMKCDIQTQIAILPYTSLKLVELEIVVDDVNDNNPIFPIPTLHLNLSENVLVDDVINLDAFQASDKDTGRNSILRYTMTPSAYFRLKYHIDDTNSSHLRLYVTKSPDHETTQEIALGIWARDAGTPSLTGHMELKIKIIDTNDNYPVFEKEIYTASLEENSPSGTTLAVVKAHDEDSGLFGKVRYSISPRNNALAQKLVRIDERRGTVWIREPLDREKHNGLRIRIEAHDSDPENPKTGETWLSINVNDINDNSPLISIDFISQSVGDTVYFPESTPNGSYIAKVSVGDQDTGKNGQIKLSILTTPVKSKQSKSSKDNTIEYFSLTNDGFLISQQDFDRESCSRYRVFLKACDHGTPSRCSKKEINVVILDVNEYSPNIETPLKTVTLREDAYVGTIISKIMATDGDDVNGYALTKNETGHIVRSQNGMIRYSITQGNTGIFSIDRKTGTIILASPLDREKKAEWKLTVSVRDGGMPHLESFCTIIVKVTDVNDNSPIFINPGVNNSLIYADILTNNVITTIKVRDFDAGDNGKVSYYLLSRNSQVPEHQQKNLTKTNSYFILNPTSGDLRFNFSKPNISNAIGIHDLVIRAKDAGAVPMESKITLRVAVGEYGKGNLKHIEEASASMNFLVLAISLGCATTFLLFLIIVVVVRCRKINREISSLTRKPEKESAITGKCVSSKFSTHDEIKVKNHDEEIEKKSEKMIGSDKSQKQLGSHHDTVLQLLPLPTDEAEGTPISDSDSGKGESDIEAASLLVNESRAFHQAHEFLSKCTETCRIYGHSDECWMPTKDEDILKNHISPAMTHYDWNRLKPRYFSPVSEKGRKGSRCSYASTCNTDNDSFVTSAATSHHSVHNIVVENAKRQQIQISREQQFLASGIQSNNVPYYDCYPSVPIKYTNIPKSRSQSCSSSIHHQLDAVYEVNYSSRPNTAGKSTISQAHVMNQSVIPRFSKRHASYANDFEPLPQGTHI